jgi:dTDP-4-amino-4,6-dideoxygalactose transaminase
MMYPIVVRNGQKEALCNHLEENDVETREMVPLTNQPAYAAWCNSAQYPVADWVNRGGLYIGCHQDLTVDDLEYMIGVVTEGVHRHIRRKVA